MKLINGSFVLILHVYKIYWISQSFPTLIQRVINVGNVTIGVLDVTAEFIDDIENLVFSHFLIN